MKVHVEFKDKTWYKVTGIKRIFYKDKLKTLVIVGERYTTEVPMENVKYVEQDSLG